ncbi:hypothetical protein ENUP19_0317G0072 [Entamoeba nuttalli]|uniref:Uncharacterized protein n=1 Tax=Entamoeba nuttalli TaxID=412467 RepID=A0ABQ0DWE4_9EUKA
MVKKEIIQWLNQLNQDEISYKITVLNKIIEKKIDLNDFLVCCGDFTRSISYNLTSFNDELLSLSYEVMIQWISIILSQPKIQIKYYDLLIIKFIDGLYYAINERIQFYIDHIIPLITTSQIFITRHLSQLIHSLSFHIQTHNKSILPIIIKLLNTISIPDSLWNDLIVFLYLQYHFSKDQLQSSVLDLLIHLSSYNPVMTSNYIQSFLKSLKIEDESMFMYLV